MRLLANRSSQLRSLISDAGLPTYRRLVRMVVAFSLPAILAQLSSILMQCIDAAMVGSLGAQSTAAIGLVSTTIWMFGGLCSAIAAGFSVQVAHLVGAGRNSDAASVLRQAMLVAFCCASVLSAIGISISSFWPMWLGGADDVVGLSSSYFFLYSCFLPVLQMNFLAGSMLRCSGNMLVPGLLNVVMCVLDVVFNFFLIFPSRTVSISDFAFDVPGAGLGVAGAAWGSGAAILVSALVMWWFLFFRSREIGLHIHPGSFRVSLQCIGRAVHIGFPLAIERSVLCVAQIVSTMIVAPLGTIAVAANSLGITAESLCYMPGYGIADASTTFVGQCLGGNRQDLARRFARISMALGVGAMSVLGVVMYIFAPEIFSALTPDVDVRSLGSDVLRVEAFAEPMFAASIVGYGIFVGTGDTLVPSLMNLASMWLVRITLAALLAPVMGLKGVWLAMCIELCFRGLIYLVKLGRVPWLK